MSIYEFTIKMIGEGEEPGMAWDDAWEKFHETDGWRELPKYQLIDENRAGRSESEQLHEVKLVKKINKHKRMAQCGR